MVPLTGQNTVNDMVDRINEVTQEIENVAVGNANAVQGPASSVVDQIMAFSDTTGKNAKAANISPFVYSILDDANDAAVRATLGLKSAAVLDAATAATANTVVQRDASGNITGVGITATSGFVGNGSQITSLNMGNVGSGTLAVANGGTGTTAATGTGSIVKNTSPTLAGTPLSTTAAADTNTTQIATTAFVVGQASSTSPVMNGSATVGTSLRYARADHVHPSDTTKVNTSLLGVANGVATLDSGGKVPTSQLPAYVDDVLEYANQAAFPATGETGKIYVALDTNKTYRWSGSVYVFITSGAVDSVAGKTGVVTLVKGDVGLGNVDNTSDANKPVSTAQATALAAKSDTATTVTKDSSTGSASLPAGTTAQRSGSPGFGAIRANSTITNVEWWNGTTWTLLGGGAGSGATGGDQDKIFLEVDQLVTSDWTIGGGVMNSGVTISIAAPGVFTYTAHGLTIGQPIRLTTTGILPSGLAPNIPYYVVAANFTSNTFSVSATEGGTAITTTGTQSGTHSFGKLKNSLVVKELKVAPGKSVTIPSGSSMVIVGGGGGNSAAASYVNTTANQTIAGVKNFTSAPTLNGVDLTSIGVGQTWQDVTASRALGTTYTNTTGKAIFVSVRCGLATGGSAFTVNVAGVQAGYMSAPGNMNGTLYAIVPSGATYSAVNNTGATLGIWSELR